MKKTECCILKTFTLAKTIVLEEWLSDMAAKGFMLQRIANRKYYFIETAPSKSRFFLMDPEIGENSDSWVFYEFCKDIGKRIPSSGFFSPSHALIVEGDYKDEDKQLINYYFKYRNYRIARRLFKNSVISLIIILMCLIVGLSSAYNHFAAIIPYLVFSFVFEAYFMASFFYFVYNCRRYGQSKPMKKPIRPGYEQGQ